MSVDWSQFRDGDKVRVVFEGTWRTNMPMPGVHCLDVGNGQLHSDGSLRSATSAELIERPFTPPPEGTLFRVNGAGIESYVWISLGVDGFRIVRGSQGSARVNPDQRWSFVTDSFRDSIEVLDI